MIYASNVRNYLQKQMDDLSYSHKIADGNLFIIGYLRTMIRCNIREIAGSPISLVDLWGAFVGEVVNFV